MCIIEERYKEVQVMRKCSVALNDERAFGACCLAMVSWTRITTNEINNCYE